MPVPLSAVFPVMSGSCKALVESEQGMCFPFVLFNKFKEGTATNTHQQIKIWPAILRAAGLATPNAKETHPISLVFCGLSLY